MPKRHGQLFEACFTPEGLLDAYHQARRGKRNSAAVKHFERDLGANLARLHDELHSGAYTPRPYHQFDIVSGHKRRTIAAPAFRDVVVQHAIYREVLPVFERTWIDQSHGCRPGYGIHSARDQLQRYMQQSPPGSYTLQMDIRRFYYRIDRSVLAELLAAKIKDSRVLRLMLAFAERTEPAGVPIGNLLSQLYGLIYLNPFDHWVKRELKVRRYVRYVDDFVIIGVTRDEAHDALAQAQAFLAERLGLDLSKWRIEPARKGVNFAGYRVWASRRFVRKHSLATFSKSLRRGDVRSLCALMGHAQGTATAKHYRRRIRAERPDLLPCLPDNLTGGHDANDLSLHAAR